MRLLICLSPHMLWETPTDLLNTKKSKTAGYFLMLRADCCVGDFSCVWRHVGVRLGLWLFWGCCCWLMWSNIFIEWCQLHTYIPPLIHPCSNYQELVLNAFSDLEGFGISFGLWCDYAAPCKYYIEKNDCIEARYRFPIILCTCFIKILKHLLSREQADQQTTLNRTCESDKKTRKTLFN